VPRPVYRRLAHLRQAVGAQQGPAVGVCQRHKTSVSSNVLRGDRGAKQCSLVHELLGDAANVNTRPTKTPLGTCSEEPSLTILTVFLENVINILLCIIVMKCVTAFHLPLADGST
jgi:hypothetical protein